MVCPHSMLRQRDFGVEVKKKKDAPINPTMFVVVFTVFLHHFISECTRYETYGG